MVIRRTVDDLEEVHPGKGYDDLDCPEQIRIVNHVNDTLKAQNIKARSLTDITYKIKDIQRKRREAKQKKDVVSVAGSLSPTGLSKERRLKVRKSSVTKSNTKMLEAHITSLIRPFDPIRDI